MSRQQASCISGMDLYGQFTVCHTEITTEDQISRLTQLQCTDSGPADVFVGFLTSQQQASVSQGRICSINCACCHTETEAADKIFCPIQPQYTDTGPTSPNTDPITPGAWQGSHWSVNF